jgi:hypothetical protein
VRGLGLCRPGYDLKVVGSDRHAQLRHHEQVIFGVVNGNRWLYNGRQTMADRMRTYELQTVLIVWGELYELKIMWYKSDNAPIARCTINNLTVGHVSANKWPAHVIHGVKKGGRFSLDRSVLPGQLPRSYRHDAMWHIVRPHSFRFANS